MYPWVRFPTGQALRPSPPLRLDKEIWTAGDYRRRRRARRGVLPAVVPTHATTWITSVRGSRFRSGPSRPSGACISADTPAAGASIPAGVRRYTWEMRNLGVWAEAGRPPRIRGRTARHRAIRPQPGSPALAAGGTAPGGPMTRY